MNKDIWQYQSEESGPASWPQNKALYQFHQILCHLIFSEDTKNPFGRLNIPGQFDPRATSPRDVAKSLNAAFLLVQCGLPDSQLQYPLEYLREQSAAGPQPELASFYLHQLEKLQKEFLAALTESPELDQAVSGLLENLRASGPASLNHSDALWPIFFPEGSRCLHNSEDLLKEVRQKRRVKIEKRNSHPINDPAEQVLFTANLLISPNFGNNHRPQIGYEWDLEKRQLHWFDHPILLGAEPSECELAHGVSHLKDAMDFEREHGTIPVGAKLACLISISPTHPRMDGDCLKYAEEVLRGLPVHDSLDIYLATEQRVVELKESVLFPAMVLTGNNPLRDDVNLVLGVEGHYGRHFNFLKAMAAFWQVFINQRVKATFKFDLDQSFPQEMLWKQTGKSALQCFLNDLWGAIGMDAYGKPVELGFMAGALVNDYDLPGSIFKADTVYTDCGQEAADWLFCSEVARHISTEAEHCCRVFPDEGDPGCECFQRIHVTGGTTAALVDALRRHRPFTPALMGRAEDQAYLLGKTAQGSAALRWLHNPYLRMRHDLSTTRPSQKYPRYHLSKKVGDLRRTLLFTYMARWASDDFGSMKSEWGPFTGSFMSRLPRNLVFLRLALQAAALFAAKEDEAVEQGRGILEIAVAQIGPVLRAIDNGDLLEHLEREQRGWGAFYETLDGVESLTAKRDQAVLNLLSCAQEQIRRWRFQG